VTDETEPAIKRGQVWRRKKTGALVRVVSVKNVARASAPYYDVAWENVVKPFRRGMSYEEYWYKNCELVEDVND
jgi:hypothetical protein